MSEKSTLPPKIMGIMNLTPDSFYPGSRKYFNQPVDFKEYERADIIDIGCESTRPGSHSLKENNEMERLRKILDHISTVKQTLSIDTYKPAIARLALDNGFDMINDIHAGGKNGEMFELAIEYNCQIVLMHMKGKPINMQNQPYYRNVFDEILYFFENKLNMADNIGLKKEQIILDPGIGFGKRIIDNDIIINRIKDIKQLGFPILIGISRKSFLSIDDDSSEDRLATTLGVTAIAINNGADIVRVHDVEETYKMSTIVNRILRNNNINKESMN